MDSVLPDIQLTPRESVSSELTRKLVEHLVRDRHLEPGDRLPSERQLAEAFGIGRSAVREALKALSILGVVEVRQGAGTFFREPHSELLPQVIEWGLLLGDRKVMDLVETRRHIEIISASLAAERRDDAAVRDLEQILDRMAAADNRTDEFVDADIAFHLRVVEAAGNTVLSNLLKTIQSLLRVWITRVVESADSSGPLHLEHLPIFEAVRDGDVSKAQEAMRAHMDSVSARLLETLSSE